MKVIGVVVGKNKDSEFHHTKLIIEKLLERGFEILTMPEISSCMGLPATEPSRLFEDSDLIICVGGDGTFLSTARRAFAFKKPVLGINKGTVGFLAEVEISEIEMAIESLVTGRFSIQPRMVLDVKVIRNGEKVFENSNIINDIAIINSIVPIKTKKSLESDIDKNEESYVINYEKALLDRQFLHYKPIHDIK